MTEERDMEELTVSQIAREYKLNRSTVNKWINEGISGKKLTARKEWSELGQPYYLVQRGTLEAYLGDRPKRGRTLKHTR